MHVQSLVMSNSLRPHGLQPTRILCPWDSPGEEYWSRLPCLLLGELPNPGIGPRSPTLQADSLLTEPPGKPLWGGLSFPHLSFLTCCPSHCPHFPLWQSCRDDPAFPPHTVFHVLPRAVLAAKHTPLPFCHLLPEGLRASSEPLLSPCAIFD